MRAAQGLYSSFGFSEIGAYVHNPVPGMAFLEKALG
jgi:hypothetical protein